MNDTFRIAVVAGDGVGPEVIDAAVAVLRAAERRIGCFSLDIEAIRAGAAVHRETGADLSAHAMTTIRQADAALLGPTGLPGVRSDDGGEIATARRLRDAFGLHLGVRPAADLGGTVRRLLDRRARRVDVVVLDGEDVVRGSTGPVSAQQAAETIGELDRCCRGLLQFGRRLSARRRAAEAGSRATGGRSFPTMAAFRTVLDPAPGDARDPAVDAGRVGVLALRVGGRAWDAAAGAAEGLVSDLMADLGRGMGSGVGTGPCADVGDRRGVFRPAHGSMPDLAGRDRADPTGAVLAAAMMLDWLGERHRFGNLTIAARLIETTVAEALATGRMDPVEQGGRHGTRDATAAILRVIDERWRTVCSGADDGSALAGDLSRIGRALAAGAGAALPGRGPVASRVGRASERV